MKARAAMRPRPRWEVRVHSYNLLADACALPTTERVISTTTYRWRWFANAQCFLWNVAPHIAGMRFWATLHRAPPKLRIVEAQLTKLWPRVGASP